MSSSAGGLPRGYSPRGSSGSGNYNYIRDMMSRFSAAYNRRREAERRAEEAITSEGGVQDVLKTEIVEFYAKDNAKDHKTDMYDIVEDSPSNPVFRRGNNFFMAMRFDRAYLPTSDNVRVIFSFGPRPSAAKGTRAYLLVKGQQEFTAGKLKWGLRVHHHQDATLTLQIQIPPTAYVGVWDCCIETKLQSDKKKKLNYQCKEDIYILFNPFCKEDTVYMPNETHREEYVMNETGKVFVGAYKRVRGRRWVFGQFHDVVLPCAICLLELSGLNHLERNNPVMVSRAISAVVNSNDENGLLEGRWDGEYSDGVPPYGWTGSVKILQKFLESGGKPVKYGQCWVFSCLTTSICRTLGIPCRSVTNIVSAHDTDHSLTVDKYFDMFGDEIEGGPDGESYDSIWNFHVWNDVWMARMDLPPGYGGWQAIDSTPQELSDNKMQCGPASLAAIRLGEVGFAYDMAFLFAEVNADICHFKEDEESDWGFSRMKINKFHVGRQILTKSPDNDDDDSDNDMHDIIADYKNPEGSKTERLAVFNAVRGVDKAHQYYDMPEDESNDVLLDLIEIDKVPYGEPFQIVVKCTNQSKEKRTVTAFLSASSVFYTGVRAKKVKRAAGEFSLEPGKSEVLQVKVTPTEYLDKLVDYCMMKIYAVATVKETHQSWSEEDDFQLEKPKLHLKANKYTKVGSVVEVEFCFTNPLNLTLTECVFSFEGSGLSSPRGVVFRDVLPNETVLHMEKFIPKKTGKKKIVATFGSRQMVDINGSHTIIVRKD